MGRDRQVGYTVEGPGGGEDSGWVQRGEDRFRAELQEDRWQGRAVFVRPFLSFFAPYSHLLSATVRPFVLTFLLFAWQNETHPGLYRPDPLLLLFPDPLIRLRLHLCLLRHPLRPLPCRPDPLHPFGLLLRPPGHQSQHAAGLPPCVGPSDPGRELAELGARSYGRVRLVGIAVDRGWEGRWGWSSGFGGHLGLGLVSRLVTQAPPYCIYTTSSNHSHLNHSHSNHRHNKHIHPKTSVRGKEL
jgi:hypothetical protein